MHKLRKALAISVMAFTVFSMCAVVAPVAKAAAVAGDLIKMDGLSSVYFLAADGKRYVFPNEQTYFSWYSDFSSVKTIPQSELESYPLGKNVTIRPGTKLVKITTDPKVYAVEPNGVLKHVPDEATAKTLYGDMWAKRVVDVSDAFFTNYTIGTGQVSATAYPAGSLIKLATAPEVYYIDAEGKARKIASEAAFLANRFKWGDIITATIALPAAGSDITGAEGALTDTSSGAGGAAGAGTGLTVSLASDTPESGNIPSGSPTEFTKINLTASNDGAVSITGLVISSFDLGDATKVDDVSIFDGKVKVGSSKNMTADRIATFNFSSPIVIAAGTTKSLTVKATIEAGVTSGNYALGIAKAADIATNGAAVSGSFPVRGNTKAVVSATIGTITMSTVDATASNNKFGEDNVKLAGFTLAAANEPVLWESIRFRNAGTNVAGIVENLKLLVDGDEVATAASLTDKYVTFALNNYRIAKGDSIAVEVYGDLGIANVNNTVNLYIESASDMVFTGQDFGFGIQVGAAGYASLDQGGDGIVVTLSAGDFTIDMDKGVNGAPARDVRPGDSNVVLAVIKMQSNGENATINSITETGVGNFYITGSGLSATEIKAGSVELRDRETGATYDVTETASTTVAGSYGWTLSITDDIVLRKGVAKTFELRVDLAGPNDSTPIDNNDTLQVVLGSAAMSITGDESNANITNVTPSSVSSAIMTVKTSSLTWTTGALTNKTVVPGAADVLIYGASAEAGASSLVKITSVKLTTAADASNAFTDNNIAKLDLYMNGKLLKSTANLINEVAGAGDTITFNGLDATNRVIPAGTKYNIEVKATFASSFSPTGTFSLTINSGTDDIVASDVDNANVAESVNNGTASRSVTLAGVGTLKAEILTTDVKADVDTYLLAGSQTTKERYLGEIKFTVANEPIKIQTLVLGQASTTTGADLKAIKLFDKNGVEIASVAPEAAGHANFKNLNKEIPADQVTSWFIGVEANTINADGDPMGTATFNNAAQFRFASSALAALGLQPNKAVTAQGVNSGQTITIIEDPDGGTVATGQYSAPTILSKSTTITGSVLNSVVNAMTDATLANGTGRTIAKYKFVFDNGLNRTSTNEEMKAEMRSLTLTISTSTGVALANVKAYIDGNAANKTSGASVSGGLVTINLTQLSGTTEKVDGEVTLVIVADISGVDSNDTLQTSIADLSADFTYNGNNGDTGPNFSNARLDISDVIGALLSN